MQQNYDAIIFCLYTHFPSISSMSPRDAETPRIRPLHDSGCNSSAGKALSMYARYAW